MSEQCINITRDAHRVLWRRVNYLREQGVVGQTLGTVAAQAIYELYDEHHRHDTTHRILLQAIREHDQSESLLDRLNDLEFCRRLVQFLAINEPIPAELNGLNLLKQNRNVSLTDIINRYNSDILEG